MQCQDQVPMFIPINALPQTPNRTARHSIILGLIFILIVSMLPPPPSPSRTDPRPNPMTATAPPAPTLSSIMHNQQTQPQAISTQPKVTSLTGPSIITLRATLADSIHHKQYTERHYIQP